MLTDDRAFRKRFFQAMQDEPLERYDVHPLIAEHIREQAASLRAKRG